MVCSMTGYGRAETIVDGQRYSVEIKSLNHRYLEVSLRLPACLSALEIEIKKKISTQVVRGKIEMVIRRDTHECTDNGEVLTLNLPLAKNYYAMLMQLKQALNLSDDIGLNLIAAQRDVFTTAESVSDAAILWEGLAPVLDDALAAMIDMRSREGNMLCRDLTARLNEMDGMINQIEAKAPQVTLEYQRRLSDRIRELTGGPVIDEARLSQEIAIFAEKSDITEEIVRFRSHIEQFATMLKGEAAIGRKIDFLIQEMNREVNTIGSKSSDADISMQVIEIKSELAKLREQVQNLE